MPLIDLLTTNAFTLGVQTDSYGNSLPRIPGIPPNGGWDTYFNIKNANYNQVGHSKNLKLPSSFTDMGTEQGWNNNRISWANDGGLVDVMADPTFVIGESHINDGIVDGTGGRGGQALQQDRRIIDKERIESFFNSPQGREFIRRQRYLQALNPNINTTAFNKQSLLNTVGEMDAVRWKRHGISPEIAGMPSYNAVIGDIGSSLLGGGALGEFIGGMAGGDYLDFKGNLNREFNFFLGHPGKYISTSLLGDLATELVGSSMLTPENYDVNVGTMQGGDGYVYSQPQDLSNLDYLNYMDIVRVENENMDPTLELISKDFIPFKFEVIDPHDPDDYNLIAFRAFIDSLDDNYTADHNEIKYNGRAESFYTYNKFKRAISLNFKIAAQTRHEMRPLYRKLNYLAAQTAPHYSRFSHRLITPYMRLTVGDYFARLPGVVSSVGISWKTDYPWEIKLDRSVGGKDFDQLILPHVLDITFSYLPIHSFTPRNSPKVPFIGINGIGSGGIDWTKKPLSIDASDYPGLQQNV